MLDLSKANIKTCNFQKKKDGMLVLDDTTCCTFSIAILNILFDCNTQYLDFILDYSLPEGDFLALEVYDGGEWTEGGVLLDTSLPLTANVSGVPNGTYTVRLKSVNTGTVSDTFTLVIDCEQAFRISYNKLNGETLSLSGVFQNGYGDDANILSVDWGDGTVNSELEHTYTADGNYTIEVQTADCVVAYLYQISGLISLPNGGFVYLNILSDTLTEINANLPNGLLYLIVSGCTSLTNLPYLPDGLEYLDAAGCTSLIEIPELPYTILDLRCNESINLTSIPNLPNGIERLICNDNQIEALPILPSSLIELVCASNAITVMPFLPAFLQIADFRFNQITTIPNIPTSLSALRFDGNQITTIPTIPNDGLLYITGSQNNLTVAAVNAVLQQLQTLGVTTGQYSFDGQTPPAPPSGGGIIAYDALIAAGNYVTTD